MVASKRTQPQVAVTQLRQRTSTDIYRRGRLLRLAKGRACAWTWGAVSIAAAELAKAEVVQSFAVCHGSLGASRGRAWGFRCRRGLCYSRRDHHRRRYAVCETVSYLDL